MEPKGVCRGEGGGTSLTERCSHRVGWSAGEGGRDSGGGCKGRATVYWGRRGVRVVSKPSGLCEAHINHSSFWRESLWKKRGGHGGFFSLFLPLSFPLSMSLSLARPLCAKAFLDICPDLNTEKTKHSSHQGSQQIKRLQTVFWRVDCTFLHAWVCETEKCQGCLYSVNCVDSFFTCLFFQILEASLQTKSSALLIIKEFSRNLTCDLSLMISASTKISVRQNVQRQKNYGYISIIYALVLCDSQK